jgi:hypothetical protein
VCGKTGTAQRGKNITKKDFQKTYWEKDDALFVGYSPADNPEVLVAAVVEHGGHGASIAMPIVNKVVKAYFDLKAARAAAAQSQAWTPPELLPPKTPQGVAASQDRFLLTTGSTQSPSSPR